MWKSFNIIASNPTHAKMVIVPANVEKSQRHYSQYISSSAYIGLGREFLPTKDTRIIHVKVILTYSQILYIPRSWLYLRWVQISLGVNRTWWCSRLDAAQSSPFVEEMSVLIISLNRTVKIWLVQAARLCKATKLSCKMTELCNITHDKYLGAKFWRLCAGRISCTPKF